MLVELSADADVFVRERGFSRYSAGTQTLFKVVGISDLALWQARQAVFDEIPPTIVKKFITGRGNATKEEVAAALPQFVGDITYACDDQSDAVAIGVTWAKQHADIYWRCDDGRKAKMEEQDDMDNIIE